MKRFKDYCAVLLAACFLISAGCDAKPTETTEETTRATTTEATVTETEPVETEKSYPTVEIGEEFVIKEDEIYKLNVDDEVYLRCNFFDTTRDYITLFLEYNGKDYYAEFDKQDDGTFARSKSCYNPYPLTLVGLEDDGYKVKFEKKIDIPPLVEAKPSGNKDEKYTVKDYEYIETKYSVIFLDKDITVPGNIAEMVDSMIEVTQEKIGLKYTGKDDEFPADTMHPEFIYLGCAPFEELDVPKSKARIYFIKDRENKGWVSCATARTAIIIMSDLYESELNYELAHEFTHVIFEANLGYFSTTLTEGLAVYAGHAFEAYAGVKTDVFYSGDYIGNLDKITPDNASEIYAKVNTGEDGPARDNHYAYGHMMITFMFETYGKDCLKTLIDKLSDIQGDNFVNNYYPSTEEQISMLKAAYGEDFFKDFGNWYKDNHKRPEFNR